MYGTMRVQSVLYTRIIPYPRFTCTTIWYFLCAPRTRMLLFVVRARNTVRPLDCRMQKYRWHFIFSAHSWNSESVFISVTRYARIDDASTRQTRAAPAVTSSACSYVHTIPLWSQKPASRKIKTSGMGDNSARTAYSCSCTCRSSIKH